jgi:4-amino-4-deoxy-L-arabinose transferase-like glycosyltransferase
MNKAEKYILAIWFVANLILAALTVHEYGISVDEPNNQRYAADTLRAYPSFFGILYEPKYDSSYDGHGPAFVTLAALFVRIAQVIVPDAFPPDLWHYAYFITFPLTGLCLYSLARRWFDQWTAWGLLALFSTQPLLLGHAFINPKDTPFMFFLTLSVLWGFRMTDAFSGREPYASLERPARTLKDRFREADPWRRKRFLTFLTLTVAAAFALILFSEQVDLLIEDFVTFFYDAAPNTWAGRFFTSVASSNVPLEDYVSKALRLFDRIERILLATGLLVFTIYFGLLVGDTTLRRFLHGTWTQRYQIGSWIRKLARFLQNSIHEGSIKPWLTEIFSAIRSPRVILAGVALGLSTAVRAIGPVAGLIVVLYLFAKLRSRAWTIAIGYLLVAGIVTYIAWPRLWDAPIQRYFEALGVASAFPHFPGRVLFNGELHSARDLPRSYLPVLLSIQFTEPAILCIYGGFVLLVGRLLRNRIRTDLFLFIGLGFGLPLLALIVLNSTLYNNFRQALFLIPGMFMIAAFTLEFLFKEVTQHLLRVLLIVGVALPGVYSTAKLYPYEYVYYNSLVGGSAGAMHRYELDYWRISLREMALELNEVAAPGSLIVVTRSAGLLARYTRPDLVIDKPINSILDLDHGYDYIVQVTRSQGGDLYPEVASAIIIERDGAVLVTAKYVRDVSGKQD